jgi:hypothetical protein
MTWEAITILVGGLATLGIYTFLIKENPVFRFFEHLFIGVAAGFLPVLTVRDFLWPKVLQPLFGYSRVVYPDGSVAQGYSFYYLLYIIPIMFGLLYYTLYSKKYSWLSKLVIGFSLGVSAGVSFKGFFAEIIPQLLSSFKPLIVFDSAGFVVWQTCLSNMLFLFTLVTVMWYFFFSFRHEGRTSTVVNVSGRWMMMICFGAFFGSTVMARMALLVERVRFLTVEWWQVVQEVMVSSVGFF